MMFIRLLRPLVFRICNLITLAVHIACAVCVQSLKREIQSVLKKMRTFAIWIDNVIKMKGKVEF